MDTDKKSLEEIFSDAEEEIKEVIQAQKELVEEKNKRRCWWNSEKCPFTGIAGLIEADHWCKGCTRVDWLEFASLAEKMSSATFFSKEEVEEEIKEAKEEAKEEVNKEISEELRRLIDRVKE